MLFQGRRMWSGRGCGCGGAITGIGRLARIGHWGGRMRGDPQWQINRIYTCHCDWRCNVSVPANSSPSVSSHSLFKYFFIFFVFLKELDASITSVLWPKRQQRQRLCRIDNHNNHRHTTSQSATQGTNRPPNKGSYIVSMFLIVVACCDIYFDTGFSLPLPVWQMMLAYLFFPNENPRAKVCNWRQR